MSGDLAIVHFRFSGDGVVSLIHGTANSLISRIQKDDSDNDGDHKNGTDENKHRAAASLLFWVFFDLVVFYAFNKGNAHVLFWKLVQYGVKQVSWWVGCYATKCPGEHPLEQGLTSPQLRSDVAVLPVDPSFHSYRIVIV